MGKDLVFLKFAGSKLEPFTTHEVIADCAGVSRETVARLIRNHMTDFEKFGKVGFKIQPLPNSKTGQSMKLFQLNEQQATLLITFLQNTPKVTDFKIELVRQFYSMREELTRRKIGRIEGKPVRRSLTDALKDSGENERMHGHAYTAYTNLAFRLTVGKNAAQLMKERTEQKNRVATDLLTADELTAYKREESAIAALLDVGMNYPQISAALSGRV